jgi:hypothetical protein
MINNDCAFTASINFDQEQIKKEVFKNLNSVPPGLASHQRMVSSSEYLSLLQNQYPFLSNLYNIFKSAQSFITPVHIDYYRNCALNIPISNTQNSHTVFYKLLDPIQLRYIPERVYSLVESPMTEIFRFTLTEPTLINTKMPHGVLDSGDQNRIIMSWSVNDKYTYDDIKKILGV